MLLRLARAGIFYSEGVRDMWVKRGMPKQKLFVAYNALDTDMSERIRANITEQDLSNFRREHLLENKKVIIFCGRLLKKWKKPHIMILALKQIIEKIPNAKAIVIGDGPTRQEIEELIKQLGMGKYVDVLGGVYDEEILAKYFLSSKAMIIPAAAGLSIQHAFGYGLPVVVGDNKLFSHGPEIELVTDGVTGLFCRDEDVDDFAQKIQLILSDEKLYDRLSKAAYQVIKEKYNVDNMAKGIIDAARYSMGV
jgi:glycosyltransferase involved in cell wall biosynthesis